MPETKALSPIESLSEIVAYMKYARYLPDKQRREVWKENVDRNKNMHIKSFPDLSDEIENAYKLVYEKKILPSMRSLQFGGLPIEVNNARIYNCAYLPIDHPVAFAEAMFLGLSGTGVGFSVQKEHVAALPKLKKPIRKKGRRKRFLIGDSIEGWADAIRVLVESYFYGKQEVDFDFRSIRKKGERLITSGGHAPGPEPLRVSLAHIQSVFENAIADRGEETSIKPIEAHDIVCHAADAIYAGGIRRAALISLFSADDFEMLEAKFGDWWEHSPQRARANNSVVLDRDTTTETQFREIWKKVELSGAGEPGIFWNSNPEKKYGTNPCCEISLKEFSFCNLVEINASDVQSQEDLNDRAQKATFIATLQASYTNFHYLRDEWRNNTEEDALIGVSMTGIASGSVLDLDLTEAASVVNSENERVAEIIGINPAARRTTVKPSGTSSLVVGSSSGIHAWHDKYYIRRVRVGKNEGIYQYLYYNHPEMVEDDAFQPETQAVISVPQKAPEGAITRHDEDAVGLLERTRRVNQEWVREGWFRGPNSNNVSVTVSIREDEWEKVGDWMWENRELYNGISVLPYDGGTYQQMPFESIDEERYKRELKNLRGGVDLTRVIELEDNTDLQAELACAGGACEVVVM